MAESFRALWEFSPAAGTGVVGASFDEQNDESAELFDQLGGRSDAAKNRR